MGAPPGEVLVPGLYENASRFGSVDGRQPMLQLSGNHRADNEVTGFFRVLEAEYGADFLVTRFAVDFTQYEEGDPNRWVTGSFRFNSTVPDPGGTCLLIPLAALCVRPRRARLPDAAAALR